MPHNIHDKSKKVPPPKGKELKPKSKFMKYAEIITEAPFCGL